MLNDVTITYDDNGNDNGRGGLIIYQNDDDDGSVGSNFDDDLNEDDGRTQRAIWHGMVGTNDFFPSLYSREAMGLIN